MSEKIIFSMVNVNKKYGNRVIIKDISLSFFYGAKIGVLGLNGSGKSTLLKIIAGLDEEYNGELHLSQGYSVGLLQQEPHLEKGKTVREIVEEGVADTVALVKKFEEINLKFAEEMTPEQMDDLLAEQAKVQERLDATDAWSLDSQLDFAMQALRCPPSDTIIDHLSGGEKRRVALCRLLLQKPDILLLDEPTNHLDSASVHWLEQFLQQYEGTVIAVTHDRYFLDNIAGWILELDRGQGVPWKGNYSSWLEQKQKRLTQESKDENKRARTLERELEWVKMTPKARQTKSKARINSYEKMLGEESVEKIAELNLFIPPGPRLGDIVIQAKDLKKTFENGKELFHNLSFTLPKGGIVGVIGPNGVGKTTLFKLISGQEKPDSGELVVGQTVSLGYMEQSRLTLNPDHSVWQAISEGSDIIKLGKKEMNSRAYVGKFNFSGQDQQKKISALSGGERNRVQLANLIKREANVILLDEPTNDLDINTLRSLEEALINYPGCAVVISHDRWFLDRIATHILAFEEDNNTVWFEGNYSDYEQDRMKRQGPISEMLKNSKYQYQLTRS